MFMTQFWLQELTQPGLLDLIPLTPVRTHVLTVPLSPQLWGQLEEDPVTFQS